MADPWAQFQEAPRPTPDMSQDAAANGLTGEDFLKTLPADRQRQVRMFAEGRAAMPTGVAIKTPYFQKMMRDVTQFDPTFDAVDYGARAAQRKNYMGGGKQFQEMQAIATVAGHLKDLMERADALHNFEGYGPLTKPLNALTHTYRELNQDPRLAQFEATKNAVVNELAKAYRGGGTLSDASVAEWEKTINAAQTPEQLRTVIGTMNTLLASKRHAIEEGYKQTMGTTKTMPEEFTSESARSRAAFEAIDAWSRGAKLDHGAPGSKQMKPPSPGSYVYDPATKTLKAVQ